MAAAIGVAGGPVGEWTTLYLIARSLSLDDIFVVTLLLAFDVQITAGSRVTANAAGISEQLTPRRPKPQEAPVAQR